MFSNSIHFEYYPYPLIGMYQKNPIVVLESQGEPRLALAASPSGIRLLRANINRGNIKFGLKDLNLV